MNEIVGLLDTLPPAERLSRAERLVRLGEYQEAIGWGYGDFLADVAAKLRGRSEVQRASRDRRRTFGRRRTA